MAPSFVITVMSAQPLKRAVHVSETERLFWPKCGPPTSTLSDRSNQEPATNAAERRLTVSATREFKGFGECWSPPAIWWQGLLAETPTTLPFKGEEFPSATNHPRPRHPPRPPSNLNPSAGNYRGSPCSSARPCRTAPSPPQRRPSPQPAPVRWLRARSCRRLRPRPCCR